VWWEEGGAGERGSIKMWRSGEYGEGGGEVGERAGEGERVGKGGGMGDGGWTEGRRKERTITDKELLSSDALRLTGRLISCEPLKLRLSGDRWELPRGRTLP